MNKLPFLLVIIVLISTAGCAQQSNTRQAGAVNDNDVYLVIDIQSIEQPGVRWNAGATVGATANGHKIGVIGGTGEVVDAVGGVHITSVVTADGRGGRVYSNVINATTTSEYSDGFRWWKPGAMVGLTDNGKRIGVLSGTGRLDFMRSGAHVTADVTADAKGGYTYSNGISGTTTSEYWDRVSRWKAGTIIGITDNGHGIGVLSGTGKVEFSECGATVSGDVTADGKGGFIYSNGSNGTTTSEYWDGFRIWKAGAILGMTTKGKTIGVLSGTGKLDYFASGTHVAGDVVADGKGGYAYSNVVNGTTRSQYWDGTMMWKAGAVLGLKGRGIGVTSGGVSLE